MSRPSRLSGRHAQILRVLYRLDGGTVSEIAEAMVDPPSGSALRTMLGRMEERGLIERRREHRGHLYWPSTSRDQAALDATAQLLDTYFDGSVASMVTGLLSDDERRLPDEDLAELERLVQEARARRAGDDQES